MKPRKSRPNVEIRVESGPVEVNKPTANEESGRYKANPKAGFWKSVKLLLNKGGIK